VIVVLTLVDQYATTLTELVPKLVPVTVIDVPTGPLLGLSDIAASPVADVGMTGMAAASRPRTQAAENIRKNRLNLTNTSQGISLHKE